MKKNGFTPLLIVLVIVILGVVGYFGYKGFLKPLVTIKEFETTGNAIKIGFPKLSLSYPSDWVVIERANDISITKSGYKVNINQDLVAGAGICRFNDSPIPTGPSADLTTVDYKEIDSGLGSFRYFLNSLNTDKSKNVYIFCIKNRNEYTFPTIGRITIDTPVVLDNSIFTEALDIVKTIKISSQVTSERVDKLTQNGGAYSITYYVNGEGGPTT